MPYDEADQLLVEGELATGEDGLERRIWPSQREVARRYGVAPSNVAAFAKQHRCTERRAAYQAGEKHEPISAAEPGGRPQSRHVGKPNDSSNRKPGRPRKSEAPLIALEELDRLLVFGEVQQAADGASTTVYPTYRQLAERYGVAPSFIASYVKSHNCVRRREEAKTRIALRVEDKLIEKRAEAMAVAKDDVVRMIDEYLLSFEKALKEGRVRSDNPTDVNTLVRLKEFILGGADSRQELHAALSLESIQQRHARMLRDQRDAPELTGVVDATATDSTDQESNAEEPVRLSGERSVLSATKPPPPPTEPAAQETNNHGQMAAPEESRP